MKKRDAMVLITLTILFTILVLVYIGTNHIYGSMTDWIMQHTVFPDYFRTLFYSTGDITPNLGMHMGAGQNIYYFSYYGLLNPFVLLSYLFPFVKMIDYLIFINVVIVITSAYLVYKWLANNKYDYKIAFVSSILFLLINAFYHAHRHIMFIDYMPFLILGFIGIDKYFKDNKSFLFIISIFLMIMTSYYYSVGGLLFLVIYGLYKYIKINNKLYFKKFLIDAFNFILRMVVGVVMSFVLLIPTIFAILSSRSQVSDAVDIKSILIPNLNFDSILYSNYGMGFTAIAIIALIYMLFHSKREERFLSSALIIVLIMPVFMYILNGMLYLRGKVFIPMSPLIILVVAIFLTYLKEKKVNVKNYIIIGVLTILLSQIFGYLKIPFYADILLTSFFIIIYLYKPKSLVLYSGLAIIALVSNVTVNINDKTYVSKETYDLVKSSDISNLIETVSVSDTSFYRTTNLLSETSLNVNRVYNANYYQTSIYSSTYNSYYKNLNDNIVSNATPYRNKLMIATTNDIIFQTLMGVKYIVTDNTNVPVGYELVSIREDLELYKNDNVMPLGYATSNIMSENDFNKLSYPYKSEALLNSIIIDEEVTFDNQSHITKLDAPYEYIGNINMIEKDNKYTIDTTKEESIKIQFREPIRNKILFIKFRLDQAPDCSNGDISITINNVTNKLTCKQWLYFNDNYSFEYVISSANDIDGLYIDFSKGHFEISNVESYALDYDYVKNSVGNVSRFMVDTSKTKGNIIEGTINNISDGYFATTIPYDKGFSIYVDGSKVEYEKVNESFVGFPLAKGTHDIKFVYTAPGYNVGIMFSAIGFVLLGVLSFCEHRKTKK